jgi:hypothetical protein
LYYNARYYDPTTAQFTQPDTIVPAWSDPAALNRFAYVRGNPVRYEDPRGHETCGYRSFEGEMQYVCWSEIENLPGHLDPDGQPVGPDFDDIAAPAHDPSGRSGSVQEPGPGLEATGGVPGFDLLIAAIGGGTRVSPGAIDTLTTTYADGRFVRYRPLPVGSLRWKARNASAGPTGPAAIARAGRLKTAGGVLTVVGIPFELSSNLTLYQDLPAPTRVVAASGRTAFSAGGAFAGGVGGAKAGAALGTPVCGPPCSAAGAFIGGGVGAFVGSGLAQKLWDNTFGRLF